MRFLLNSIALVILITIVTNKAFAQQSPQYSHYVFNYYAENPASAATHRCLDLKLGGRYQWVGFEGAPRTYFASAIIPLTKRKGLHKVNHVVGAFLSQDNIGIYSQTYIKLSYTLETRLFKNTYGALGVFAGIRQLAINNPLGDPAIRNDKATHYPDIMPGLMLYNTKYYLGLSVNQVIPKEIKNFTNSQFVNEYFLSFGRRSSINSTSNFYYSANVKTTFLTPPAIDLNIFWEHRNFTIGLGYRIGESVIALIKFKLFNSVTMAYAFDFPLNKMINIPTNSHEIMLNYSKCLGSGVGGAGGSGNRGQIPGYGICPAYQ